MEQEAVQQEIEIWDFKVMNHEGPKSKSRILAQTTEAPTSSKHAVLFLTCISD